MGNNRYKNKHSDLRWLIKQFKDNADKHELLRSYVPALKRAIALGPKESDVIWRAEGQHQLALFYVREGEHATAEHYFIESLCNFSEDEEPLGMCRTLRDYALLHASCGEYEYALFVARQTLALHDKDLALLEALVHDELDGTEVRARAEAKGERQKRISLSYVWFIKLLQHVSDTDTLEKLVEFAMSECDDCCPRDQEQIIGFALTHAPVSYRQMLRLRLGILYAQRKQPVAFAGNIVRFGLDMPRFTASYTYRILFRRE